MKKIIFITLLLSNLLTASMLLDKPYPICIEDYYYKSGSLYYLTSNGNVWKSTTSDKLMQHIYFGFEYDATNNICKPEPYNQLGLSPLLWHFLMALVGVIFGAVVMIFSIKLFMRVGSK